MANPVPILAPERLTAQHEVADFANGKHASLDDWLKNQALASEVLSARTYVICSAAHKTRVVGYYAISTAMEERRALPTAKLRRGLPHQVPMLLLGRLALDVLVQRQGLGADLLSDAIRRCCAVSEIAGARAILAHAIDDDAVGFYRYHGFVPSPLGERVMLLPMETARAALSG